MRGKEIDLSFSDFDRVYADLPPAPLANRFFEENPFQGRKRAAIARPGTNTLGNYGTGPIRKIFSQPGIFQGALFFVSGDTLYRRDVDGTTYAVNGTIFGDGEVSMCVVKGLDYERLFIADGSRLQFYSGGTNATAVLTNSGGTDAAEGDQVEINGIYYEFNAVVVDGLGTSSSPFSVLLGGTWDATWANLSAAINFTGTSGTTYSSTLGGQRLDIEASYSSPNLTLTAIDDTEAGNAYTVTDPVDGGGNITVPATELFTGGGVHGISGVEVPDGLGPTHVASLNSYVVVGIGRTDRFYWIEPAEVTIDPLDFATAEAAPDTIVSIQAMQDTLWFIGQTTTEVWYATGQADLPFNPVNGRVYDRGALEGTVVNIKGTLYLVDQDYIVYAISGGPQRISNHGIEEQIRLTVAEET